MVRSKQSIILLVALVAALGRNSTFPLLVALVVALGRNSTRNSTFPWWVEHILIRYSRVRRIEWRCESSRLGLTTDFSMVW